MCFECRFKERERGKKRYYKNLTETKKRIIAENVKSKRTQRKADGLCPQCGKRTPTDGYSYCAYCRAYHKRYYHKNKQKKDKIPRELWIDLGLCYNCEKPELVSGKKLCPECYRKVISNMEKARNARKPENNYFRMANDAFWRGKQDGKESPVRISLEQGTKQK